MCSTVKSPTPAPVKAKDPVYLRNPYLDGLGIGAENSGRNSLRIDAGSGSPSRAAYTGIAPNPTASSGARRHVRHFGVAPGTYNAGLGIAS